VTRSHAATVSEVAVPRNGVGPLLRIALPAALLLVAVCVAYANAWPDTLVFDDKPFRDHERFADWTEIPRYFSQNVWAVRGVDSNLYRPLLLVSVAIDANLFGEWFAGYHLTNILLHAVVSVFIFALTAGLLARDARTRHTSALAAFLAALLFAVHPVNTEVVNSIFNRSTMLAALGLTGGLWWLLRYLETRPALAWGGLCLAYTYALFCRETAIVLPGIAALLVLIYTEGPWPARLRRTLPVLVLVVPMVFYLVVRGQVLSGEATRDAAAESRISTVVEQIEPGRLLDGTMILGVAGAWAEAYKVTLWPHPLQINRPKPSLAAAWIGLFLHLGLVGFALFLLSRGHKGLPAGLLMFYLALLPSSRLFGTTDELPHLSERYLYEPLIGITLLAAYGLSFLNRRFDRVLAAAPAVLCLMLLVPVTWARNAQWADEITLFESDYRAGARSGYFLRLLTAAYLREHNLALLARICDENSALLGEFGLFTSHCASAYSYTGRSDDAIRAYLAAAQHDEAAQIAHWNLAQHYMRQQRREDAEEQFELAVEAETDPAMKAYYKGHSIMLLHPGMPEKWAEARPYLAEAVALDPDFAAARTLLGQVDGLLGQRATEPEDP
jgi:tetratricopeptide (TPR) repeat protein